MMNTGIKKQSKSVRFILAINLLAALLLSSGTVFAQEGEPVAEPPEPGEAPPAAPDEKTAETKAVKPWTFMVYMIGADSDWMEESAIEQFIEMGKAGSDANVNIVVQMDRHPEGSTDYGNWTNTRRFYVTPNMTPVGGIGIGEANMGSAATLKSFILWAKTNYPANKYALVIWAPNSSVFGSSREIPSKGAGWDDTNNGDILTNKEISTVLSQVTTNGSYKFEFVGFDVGELAQMEIHPHVANYAKYGAGSIDFSESWAYKRILNLLKANPAWSGATLANTIVNQSFFASSGWSTYTAVRYGSYYTTLLSRLNSFSNELISTLNANPGFRATIHSARGKCEDAGWNDFTDIAEFALIIKNAPKSSAALKNTATNLISAISNMVTVYKQPQYNSTARKGISIFFPTENIDQDGWIDWDSMRDSYKANYWLARDSKWDEFLDKYYNGDLSATVSWGTAVQDLDAHLWLPSATPYHVYYGNQGTMNGYPYAALSGDDTSSLPYDWGREAITVSQIKPGIYQFAVYKHSNETTTLKNSGASVKVIKNGVVVKTLQVSTAGGVATGRWWKVFTYNKNTNTFTWTNALATSPGSAYSTSGTYPKK